jgi:hypothetical protein
MAQGVGPEFKTLCRKKKKFLSSLGPQQMPLCPDLTGNCLDLDVECYHFSPLAHIIILSLTCQAVLCVMSC